jgi:hypothetical protein
MDIPRFTEGTSTMSDFNVSVKFTYNSTLTPNEQWKQWQINPHSFDVPYSQSQNDVAVIKYGLSEDSTPGWGFTQITLELPGGTQTITHTQATPNNSYTIGGVVIQFYNILPAYTQIAIKNNQQQSTEVKISVTLTVAGPDGTEPPQTSPDPQIVLVPR